MKNTIRIILITFLLLAACNKPNHTYNTTYDAEAAAFADSVYDAELLRERMEQYESEGICRKSDNEAVLDHIWNWMGRGDFDSCYHFADCFFVID